VERRVDQLASHPPLRDEAQRRDGERTTEQHTKQRERSEIERDEVHVCVGHRLADPVRGLRPLRAAAAAEDHARALRRERARSLEADPAVRSGHDRHAVREIRDVGFAPGHHDPPR
jgi:hypothetical protein